MKSFKFYPFLFVLLLVYPFLSSCESKCDEKVVIAYVSSGMKELPDPQYVTHINYAFGVVNSTFDGVDVRNPDYLRKIVSLKKEASHLKVVLSIGGWGAGGFSEMASTENTMDSFVGSCIKTVEDFNLDGLDLDWEYPTSSSSGIKSSPEDMKNFTTLVIKLRNGMGKNKLLTLASCANAQYYDFPEVIKYCDFINIMAYDMGRPPFHNSPLYPSDRSVRSIDEAVKLHLEAGIPAEQLVLGVPLYGHGDTSKGTSDWVANSIMDKYSSYQSVWDEKAQVPYLIDSDGKMLISYEDERSMKLKCEYCISKDLLGIMYWEYSCDSKELPLIKCIRQNMK